MRIQTEDVVAWQAFPGCQTFQRTRGSDPRGAAAYRSYPQISRLIFGESTNQIVMEHGLVPLFKLVKVRAVKTNQAVLSA